MVINSEAKFANGYKGILLVFMGQEINLSLGSVSE